jgi:hypothetical protein
MTSKPLIYAANVCEEDLADKGANNVHVQVGGGVCVGGSWASRRDGVTTLSSVQALLWYSFSQSIENFSEKAWDPPRVFCSATI